VARWATGSVRPTKQRWALTTRENFRLAVSIRPNQRLIRRHRQRASFPAPTAYDFDKAIILSSTNGDDIRKERRLKRSCGPIGNVAMLGVVSSRCLQHIDTVDQTHPPISAPQFRRKHYERGYKHTKDQNYPFEHSC